MFFVVVVAQWTFSCHLLWYVARARACNQHCALLHIFSISLFLSPIYLILSLWTLFYFYFAVHIKFNYLQKGWNERAHTNRKLFGIENTRTHAKAEHESFYRSMFHFFCTIFFSIILMMERVSEKERKRERVCVCEGVFRAAASIEHALHFKWKKVKVP